MQINENTVPPCRHWETHRHDVKQERQAVTRIRGSGAPFNSLNIPTRICCHQLIMLEICGLCMTDGRMQAVVPNLRKA